MKVSDYIVNFFIKHEIRDVFGYPGGMVTHLMDSFNKFRTQITAHLNYHEQAAAFAACGYAQASLKPGVAFTTSGPGVTNLLTGLCNAYYDSIPALFLTGQVNTYEAKGETLVRQKGFQETDVISIVSSVVKYVAAVTEAEELRYHLEKAYYMASEGRPGPTLLDIPMNVQRADINPGKLIGYSFPASSESISARDACQIIYQALLNARRPLVLVGAGVQNSGTQEYLRAWINSIQIPIVSSMLAVDALPQDNHYYGFIGAYGSRCANFLTAKCDLLITLGTRLDLRQTGVDTEAFAKNAKLLRVEVDENELTNKIKKDEEILFIDLKILMPELVEISKCGLPDFTPWIGVCDEIRTKLPKEENMPNRLIEKLSALLPEDAMITTDVGQNQVWVAQSFVTKGQRILFSGGHGAMGYSLPAAIGAYFGSRKKMLAFTGDGGLQMNMQELQFLARERIPVKIILLNNASLGMIRHFQEMYFDKNYVQTKRTNGYTVPDFVSVAKAYRIPSCRITEPEGLKSALPYIQSAEPALIEIVLPDDTYVFPKLSVGRAIHDQDPLINRSLFDYLTAL